MMTVSAPNCLKSASAPGLDSYSPKPIPSRIPNKRNSFKPEIRSKLHLVKYAGMRKPKREHCLETKPNARIYACICV